jgi:endonuclease/exonuclease/phosphatase family metal-dependent hydrolase
MIEALVTHGASRRRIALAAGAALVAVAAWAGLRPGRSGSAPPPARVGTFNIEEFPKSRDQIDGAFALIATLHVDVLAVEEVFDARAFADAAHARLGARWDFASDRGARGLGVLYDAERYRLASVRRYDETRIDGRGKPSLAVALEPRAGGLPLRVLVVHLQSGSEARGLRARQHAAVDRIAAELRAEPGQLVVLGDFNATDDADRSDLAALARSRGLTWATRDVACTAFWRRSDGCPTSRLDHVLASSAPASVEVAGACADGCAARASCPAYRDEISDHCPVVVTIPSR